MPDRGSVLGCSGGDPSASASMCAPMIRCATAMSELRSYRRCLSIPRERGSMSDAFALEPRSAWAGALADIGPPASAGVAVGERSDLQAATVIARDNIADVAQRLRAAYSLHLALGTKRSATGDLAFVGVGP